MTNPAQIELNLDKAVEWLKNGATPTDTARRILSYKGALLKRHLQIGVEKGAISQETADVRFNEWLTQKENKVNQAKSDMSSKQRDAAKARLENEKKVNEAKAAAIAAKRQAAIDAAAQAETEAAEAPAEEAETPEAEA